MDSTSPAVVAKYGSASVMSIPGLVSALHPIVKVPQLNSQNPQNPVFFDKTALRSEDVMDS